MKQLYPAIKKIALLIALIIYNAVADAQSLNFNNPDLESGTDLQQGCTYRFKSMVWGTATSSKPTGGQGVDETDSTQMFRVSTPSTTSATVRVGFYQTQNGWNGNGLFSLNRRGNELAPAILPVTLVSFTTQLANEKVWLAWTTKQEDNLNYYGIERSYDNKEFEQVALLFPAEDASMGNTYSYKDPVKNVTASLIYYRLKMVDKDGKYKYSEVRTVRIGNPNNGSAELTTWPNPIVNELHVSVPSSWQDQTVSCQLLNTMGSIIKSFNVLQSTTIGMSDVPAGTYYIKAANGKEISTQTIVKSRN